jgi:beta-glucosidase
MPVFKSLCLILAVASALPAYAQQVVFPECAGELPRVQLDRRIDALIAKMTPAERIAQLQDRAPAIPRLGIPAYNWWNEGLHGIARNGFATVFPQAIGLASTWDPELLAQVGGVVSTEARAKFNAHQNADSLRYAGLTIWSPNINIFRDPRWGRGQETYGEDPYLTGLLGSQFVRGVQGEEDGKSSTDFYRKADATPKHFAVHSGPESIRDGFNSQVSQHDLADTYTPAFRMLTGREGAKADALMCSYNAINGVPACANPLLQDRLRGAWGFNGYVVSDCDAVDEITEYLHFTADHAHGAADALKAGVDLDCGNTYAHLNEALEQHLVSLDDVDRALHRLLLARLRLGMLQPQACSPWAGIGADQVDTAADRKLALRAAEESMVLLKNEKQLLPLDLAGKRVAVIGPTADLLQVIEANYHGTAQHPQTLLEGLKDELGSGATVAYAQGAMLAEGVTVPVPSTALRAGTGADAAPGLTAEYFANAELSGRPAQTRVDARIDFDLDRVAPAEGLGAEYSVRWSGFLKPPAPGKYRLHVGIERCWDCTKHDGYRLWVDGKLALEDDGAKENQPDSVSFAWPDSKLHAIRLELRHTGDDEGIRLDWEAPAEAQLAEALAAAKQSDVVLAVVGLSPDLEGEALRIKVPGFNGGDRETLALPEPQRLLLAELGKLGKPMIVVVTSGSAVALGEEARGAQAIFDAWYPGEEGGHALARLLTGAANPSGRLPVTIYRSAADLPAFTDYSMAHRTYRYYDGPVQYPFGFGLSYAQFLYSAPKPSTATLNAGSNLEVSATVKNASMREGDEVAELYLVPTQVSGAPRIALGGVQRVRVKAGESSEVRFVLTPRQLSLVDAEGKRAVRAGRYRIYVGGAQPVDLSSGGAEIQITGERDLLP